MNITKPQLDALEHFRNQALTHKDKSLSTLKHISTMSDISELEFKYAIENIKNKAQVALHFHPDRLDPNNETVTENLLKSGRYKSQFETFMSNGSVSAHPSGERDLWEQDLFGGSYSFEKCLDKA